MGCGCFSCGECIIFLSGAPGKTGSSSVDDFPDKRLDGYARGHQHPNVRREPRGLC